VNIVDVKPEKNLLFYVPAFGAVGTPEFISASDTISTYKFTPDVQIERIVPETAAQ
jgi:hypothetical protein